MLAVTFNLTFRYIEDVLHCIYNSNQGKKEKGRNQCLWPIRTSLRVIGSLLSPKEEVVRHIYETHGDDRQREGLRTIMERDSRNCQESEGSVSTGNKWLAIQRL